MRLFLGCSALLPTLVTAISPYVIPQSEWDALNVTVGGRLSRGVPLSRSCFSAVGTNVTGVESKEECESVQKGYGTATFIVSKFGGAVETQWETCQKTNEGCLLDPTSPNNSDAYSPPKVCHQGSISPYYIEIQNADDVSAGFSFSKRTGVPLVVKNTGHDYTGRSIAPGTLALWTFNLKYINYSTSFVPEGCSVQGVPAVTYGAGQDMQSLYDFADANNITFIGGSGKTVGAAGGWLQGGGHSILSNEYGMGVDRVRQFRVVTPDGVSRIANACKNTDLFWALRGGGGGTFGVVLEASVEVVPHSVGTISLQWELNPTLTNVLGLVAIVVKHSAQWVREGWGGYIYPTASIIANPSLNATEAAASLKPLTDFLSSTTDGAGGGSGSGAKVKWYDYKSFLPLFEAIAAAPVPIGQNMALASRLIPSSLFTPLALPALLAATTSTFTLASGKFAFFLTSPFSYNATQDETSITPAWRDAIWHAVALADWDYDGSAIAAKTAYATAGLAIAPLRLLTPGGSAYQNEGDVYEPDWSTSFWGSNYDRLLQLKEKYDPYGLLDCWHCVGWKGKNTPIASCYL